MYGSIHTGMIVYMTVQQFSFAFWGQQEVVKKKKEEKRNTYQPLSLLRFSVD